MRLDRYTTGKYTIGATITKQLLWYFIGAPLVRSYLIPFSWLKVTILRWFGAEIGQGVRIKTGVKIKFPWRLIVKDFVWIGEDVWLDNLDLITIESHCCISQGVYLCTGNHDWCDRHFALRTAPIYIETGSWIAARATVGAGVRVGQGAVLGMGSVATRSLEPMTIYLGNPAIAIKSRKIKE
ncbi:MULTISPECIES: WcaF family extracellular polysaccharide biosynthesis acetyltransferase [Pseudanabaena]|uniref:WcaF family extracellular polysaccharide biosynthesis acetyltransferase n=2 Tax=Pseudanabaena TaxID=1152 RepID=A0A9X4RJN0_9CYAN|nr:MULTISPECIES: WcaF family extracellular polysaccharide biosynthesis acetyltransferase [Pseudanabaena]ELS30938.1 putative colanic acid biosynthesis acetyltransferase WcaF [Pseudanabaena biceps PCC 7429]MDG3496801.1 WcaF family extracellular polysaccharide biosynthesis acetyltransferase [Pseudanabaena catenata USMAC16]